MSRCGSVKKRLIGDAALPDIGIILATLFRGKWAGQEEEEEEEGAE